MRFFGKSTKNTPSTILVCALSIPILTACAMARGMWHGEVNGQNTVLVQIREACRVGAMIVIGDEVFDCAPSGYYRSDHAEMRPAVRYVPGQTVSDSVIGSDIRF